MNPLALLAFIAGIVTTGQKPEPRPAHDQAAASKDEGRKTSPEQPGVSKCHRGGWDGN